MSISSGFLGRWSRRKAFARKEGATAEDAATPEADRPEGGVTGPADTDQREGAPEPTEPPLPDIESLDRHSDFTVFMREGVPHALRKQALRRLWTLDPAFSKLDGLVEYGEDYNAPHKHPTVVRTAWRLSRGMAEPPPAEEPAARDAPVTAEAGEEMADGGEAGGASVAAAGEPVEGDAGAGEGPDEKPS